ncbi:conserved hypothetical protein [Escherichia coli]|nr:conserved hypothetical protein [Escherichia coli]
MAKYPGEVFHCPTWASTFKAGGIVATAATIYAAQQRSNHIARRSAIRGHPQ